MESDHAVPRTLPVLEPGERDHDENEPTAVQYIIHFNTALPCQNGSHATSGFEMYFCYRTLVPLVPGVPTKTRLNTPKAVTYHEQS